MNTDKETAVEMGDLENKLKEMEYYIKPWCHLVKPRYLI